MIEQLSIAIATFLLATLLAGMIRVVRGPTDADRMLAALLFGTTGVAIALLLFGAGGTSAIVDVALVLALLAAVAGVAFVQRTWRSDLAEDGDDDASR